MMDYELKIDGAFVGPRKGFPVYFRGDNYYVPYGIICPLIRFAHARIYKPDGWVSPEEMILMDKSNSHRRIYRVAKTFDLSTTQLFERDAKTKLYRLAIEPECIFLDRINLQNFEDVTIANLFKPPAAQGEKDYDVICKHGELSMTAKLLTSETRPLFDELTRNKNIWRYKVISPCGSYDIYFNQRTAQGDGENGKEG